MAHLIVQWSNFSVNYFFCITECCLKRIKAENGTVLVNRSRISLNRGEGTQNLFWKRRLSSQSTSSHPLKELPDDDTSYNSDDETPAKEVFTTGNAGVRGNKANSELYTRINLWVMYLYFLYLVAIYPPITRKRPMRYTSLLRSCQPPVHHTKMGESRYAFPKGTTSKLVGLFSRSL